MEVHLWLSMSILALCSLAEQSWARKGSENSLFLIQDKSAGKGFGAYASKEIKRGTVVLQEDPILYVAYEAPNSDFERAFHWLNEGDRHLFLKLHGETPRSKDMLNRFGLSHGTAIIPTASRFNHACRPNLESGWSEDRSSFSMWAIRDIAAGEELTHSYLGNSAIFQNQTERRVSLAKWGFVCDCLACTSQAHLSDKRRVELANLAAIQARLRTKSTSESSALDDEALYTNARQLVTLLEQEEASGALRQKAYYRLADAAFSLGKLQEARESIVLAQAYFELDAVLGDSKYFEERSLIALLHRRIIDGLQGSPTRPYV